MRLNRASSDENQQEFHVNCVTALRLPVFDARDRGLSIGLFLSATMHCFVLKCRVFQDTVLIPLMQMRFISMECRDRLGELVIPSKGLEALE